MGSQGRSVQDLAGVALHAVPEGQCKLEPRPSCTIMGGLCNFIISCHELNERQTMVILGVLSIVLLSVPLAMACVMARVCYVREKSEKGPLSAMDDSCMILWWVKNKRPYQLFVTSSRDFMDVQRRMPASKISMVTFWSGRTSDVAQGGITMRDSATAGLGDQPPAPPRTLEQIPLQELYRPVPEEVRPPVTPPPVPAEQPIEVDDEDMHLQISHSKACSHL